MTQAGLRPSSNYVPLSYHKIKSCQQGTQKTVLFLHNMAGQGRGAMDALRAVAGIPRVRLPALRNASKMTHDFWECREYPHFRLPFWFWWGGDRR